MNEITDELIKKILDFWKKYDEDNLSVENVREFFELEELVTLLFNDSYSFKNHWIIEHFQNSVMGMNNLFSKEEADRIIDSLDSANSYQMFPFLSDDKLLLYIKSASLNDLALMQFLSSDKAKIEAYDFIKKHKQEDFKYDKDRYDKYIFSLESDELKLMCLKKYKWTNDEKNKIICSLKDDAVKESYISFFNSGKVSIIRSLSTDEKKEYYLQKYFKLLSWYDKASIVASFSSDEKKEQYLKNYFNIFGDWGKVVIISSLSSQEQKLNYLNFCNDDVKVNMIIEINGRPYDFAEKIIDSIKDSRKIEDLFLENNISENLIVKYLHLIKNPRVLSAIINDLSDENKVKFLDKMSENKVIKLVKELDDDLKFKAFKYIKNPKLVISLIEHCEDFPEFGEEYEYLIDLYANYYNLNREHLFYLVNNTSLSLLKVIKNNNIVKTINSSSEEFEVIKILFDKENAKLNNSAMNDTLNTLLQRKFRIKHSDTVLIFSEIISAIQNGEKNNVINILNTICEDLEVRKKLDEHHLAMDEFVDLLLVQNEQALDILHKLTAQYIMKKRNDYVKENLYPILLASTNNKYDKNDLMKYMINNYPVGLLMYIFNCINTYDFYNNDEIKLNNDKELLKKIILYKKNPTMYNPIPEEVQRNLKTFNSLFEKGIARKACGFFSDVNFERKITEFKYVDPEFIIDIMMNLDIDKMRVGLFNDSEMLNKLISSWEQYKIGGWGNSLEVLLSDCGVMWEPEVIANFIQYFPLSYETLQKNNDGKPLTKLSLTALFDLAYCYGTDSKKYEVLLGSENFKLISSDPGPNKSTMVKEERLKKAIDYVKIARKRGVVTVPPVDRDFVLSNGKKINIVVGNFSNMINLTYGERTGACMRMGGHADSLFNFCLEDENGFHIRFVNPQTGNFVSRVSGFRNGNTVFLNELRYSVDQNYSNKDVVEACKLVAEELISSSKNSSFPIENVVVSKFFAMQESGMECVDFGIDKATKGMKDFYTDITTVGIVLATSNPDGALVPIKQGTKKASRYPVIRDKKRILYNKEASEYAAHLKCLDQVLSGVDIENVEVKTDTNIIVCFAGEDWCVTVDVNGKLETYIMSNTNNKTQAYAESQQALEYLKQNINKEIELSHRSSFGM